MGINTGLSINSQATREEKIKFYYTVRELLNQKNCLDESRSNGVFILQSDLKLREWLRFNTQLDASNQVYLPRKADESPFKQDVLQHEVKFVVTTSANVTPSFRLSRVNINQSGSVNFLNATRTRTNDLIITMGPIDNATVGKKPAPPLNTRNELSSAARDSHLAAEIGLAVSNALQLAAQ